MSIAPSIKKDALLYHLIDNKVLPNTWDSADVVEFTLKTIVVAHSGAAPLGAHYHVKIIKGAPLSATKEGFSSLSSSLKCVLSMQVGGLISFCDVYQEVLFFPK